MGECSIPKDIKDMSETNKAARYCAACRKKTDHTTLDHKYCPKKREILRERARIAREKRLEEKEIRTRETELISKVLDMSNKNDWPTLNTNTQQTKIAAIITCALLDEASQPGIFNQKLDEACEKNNLPKVKYTLEPNTAQNFLAAMTGSQNTNTMQVITKTHNNSTVKKINKTRQEIRNGMNQDSQDKNSLKQTNLEKIK